MWKKIGKEFPSYGDNITLLVTNGKEIWVVYEDDGRPWCIDNQNSPDEMDEIIPTLTHYCPLAEVALPKIKGE